MPACWWIAAKGRIFLKPPRALRPGEDMANYLLCDRGFMPTITIVAPREAAASVRFDEHLRAAEDTDFAIRLSLAGYRFQMLEHLARCGKMISIRTACPPAAGGEELACLAWPFAA